MWLVTQSFGKLSPHFPPLFSIVFPSYHHLTFLLHWKKNVDHQEGTPTNLCINPHVHGVSPSLTFLQRGRQCLLLRALTFVSIVLGLPKVTAIANSSGYFSVFISQPSQQLYLPFLKHFSLFRCLFRISSSLFVCIISDSCGYCLCLTSKWCCSEAQSRARFSVCTVCLGLWLDFGLCFGLLWFCHLWTLQNLWMGFGRSVNSLNLNENKYF